MFIHIYEKAWHLAYITGMTTLVQYLRHILQFLWRSGTRRFHRWVCEFKWVAQGTRTVPLLLTQINLIPSRISSYNYHKAMALSIPKLQRWGCRSLEMDEKFLPTLYWACDYLSILGLKLIYVSKTGPRYLDIVSNNWSRYSCALTTILLYDNLQ